MDPFGNIPLFASTLKNITDQRRKYTIIVREHIIAFGVLFAFMLVGDKFLATLGLSGESLQIAGGVVLFLIALKMIFPGPADRSGASDMPAGEPLVVPLAVPLVAGPSALATVLLFVSQAPSRLFDWVAALTIAIVTSLVVLLTATATHKLIGERILVAIERLMGLILVAVSIEMFVKGVKGVL